MTAWLLTLLTGCFIATGNGEPASEVRELTGFSAVELTSMVSADVYTGEEFLVEVYCDSNLLELVETEVKGDTLVIKTPNRTVLDPQTDCYALVSAPSFSAFASSGSGNLYAEGDLAGFAEAETSGSGELTILGIDSSDVELKSTGSGNIEAAGRTNFLSVHTSGSGDVDARALAADDAEVRISGSGHVSVTVTGLLEADLSGSGDLDVYGDPQQVDQNTSGSGDVTIH